MPVQPLETETSISGGGSFSISPSTDDAELSALPPPLADSSDGPTAYTPVVNVTTGAVLSAANFNLDDSAFSSWHEGMTTSVQHEATALREQVIQLQRDFDDASHYIRGDFAWRKQIGVFHDRINDTVVAAMEEMATRIQQSTQSLATSLEDTLKTKDLLAKQEMERHTRMYEDKLRRTRTSLKKEIERFTHLEKCLRKEETHQAKAMYERLVHQLTLEHAAKEATLHAMLRELKVAFTAMENANVELMDTIKSRSQEIERLKKMLPKPKDVAGSQKISHVGRPGSAAAAAAAAAIAAAAASDAQIQSLKQALLSANNTIDSLRKQVDESSSDRESTLKKQRLAENAAAKANDELAKAKQLLSESHGAMVSSRKEMEVLLQERSHWKELYADLHFYSGSHEHALDDAKRLAQVAQEQVESLQTQLKGKRRSGGVVNANQALQFAEQWVKWRAMDGGSIGTDHLRLVDAYVSSLSSSHNAVAADDDDLHQREAIETQLRYEFEQKYGDMLNLRISHERKRVLARIEMLWAKRAEDEAAKATVSVSTRNQPAKANDSKRAAAAKATEKGATLPQILQLVSDAFQDLGFSDWASTDLEWLRGEISRLQDMLKAQQKSYEQLQKYADAQAVRVATMELHNREQEVLLAELTERCRTMRAQLDAMESPGEDKADGLDLSRWDKTDPFTVYGQPQPIEAKQAKRVSVRARPVSASATLMNSGSAKETAAASSLASLTRPTTSHANAVHAKNRPPTALKPFLLNQLPATGSASVNTPLKQQEDHVRSVLKADLLSLTPNENQFDDGGVVGADGILQIMQRRRHNRR